MIQTVVVLICTFNRPHYLNHLLRALTREVSSADCLTLSVVIIDNGTQDVRDIVEIHRSELPIEYERFPGAGLVGARNRSLECALRHAPDFLVFIDDDEVPEIGWLNGLLSSLNCSGADFAVGPVEPEFEVPPPQWAPEFFEKTGEAFCTSNLIVRTRLIPKDERNWFQQRFSATGGEDGEFLDRLSALGATHTVARDAKVREYIPIDRVKVGYLWRRGLRDGIVSSEAYSVRHNRGIPYITLRASQKMAFGLNHLFWAPYSTRRFFRAIDDISFASGLVLGLLGRSINFYK